MEGDIYYPNLKSYWQQQPRETGGTKINTVELAEYTQNLQLIGLNEDEFTKKIKYFEEKSKYWEKLHKSNIDAMKEA